MYPEILSIGPITLYSYGAMLAAAFLVGNWLLGREWMRAGHTNSKVPDQILIGAVVGGLVGSKLLYAFTEGIDYFVRDPLGTLFSGAGLIFHGGLGLAMLIVAWVIKRHSVKWLDVADLGAPIILLSYSIARIGCFLSGDGDYGPPSDLPWAMAFPNGTVPTTVPVHPTPLYEVVASTAVFSLLWRMRTRPAVRGWMAGWAFLAIGLERVVAEYWRINADVGWGFSQAQWISVAMAGARMISTRWKTVKKLRHGQSG